MDGVNPRPANAEHGSTAEQFSEQALRVRELAVVDQESPSVEKQVGLSRRAGGEPLN
jgi:hypothetical protein